MLPAKYALSEPERADAARHCAVLEKALIAGPSDRIAAAIAGLKLAFPAQRLSDDEASVAAAMFRQALGELPAWTVERAIQFWLRREHPEGNENYAFAPSAPQLRRLALIAYQKVSGERHDLKRLLDATVEPEPSAKDDAMRARIDEMVARTFGPKEDAA